MNSSPNKIFAIDASTNSMAFAFYSYKTLQMFGKINFEGNDIYEKVGDACRKTKAFLEQNNLIEAIVIEHTIFMNSPKTAADLALVQGAILGAAHIAGIKTIGKVSPMTWQNYIGNKRLTKEEQLLIRSKNPGKSNAWYKSYERNIRKQKTIKFIEINYDKVIEDNDVADACAIGHWAIQNWDKAIS